MNIKMLLAIAVIGIIVLIGIFYLALRSTNKDVSKKEPYTSFIGKTLYTQRASVLAKNLPEFNVKEAYFITEDTNLFEGVEKIAPLPKGTKLQFVNAIHHKNGTSGFSQSLLIGKVWVNDKWFDIEYYWGEQRITFDTADKGQWIFPPGLWQQKDAGNTSFVLE
ncbi:MAG: hypothetical protein QM802_14450 [Agriterribacter sp.]